ncbi:MAG: phosphoribosylglycinamide formyltransferase [Oligoflexia bacterium]|nr:phosphoribosylglycinamide formyltransferase [Oligoflexia bacterium]
MTSFAVLASGTGSNFEAIADAVQSGRLAAKLVGVVSDVPDAGVLAKARLRGITTAVVPREKDRAAHDRKILQALDALPGGRPRFLVLAGYMRVMTSTLIQAFRADRYSRIVNIHPSLLPAFPGVAGYAQAYAHGAKIAGVTVHLVDEGLDSGPICAQGAFSISECESVHEVEDLGKELEHRLYPETLSWILPEKFKLEERETASVRRLCVRPI